MAWYDQNKIPEWKLYLQKDYHIQHLLNHKDLILQELPKVDELHLHLKTYSHSIIHDCLEMCLQFPIQPATYDRKYVYPTKAMELLTNQLFFSNLAWNKQLIQKYMSTMFRCFSSVDPSVQNINLYHAYFERLLKMIFICRVVDKLDVIAALEYEQANNQILDVLFKHTHKLSIAYCLEMLLTVDNVEPLSCFTLDFKTKIIRFIYYNLEMFLSKADHAELTENCIQILKGFLEKGINFMATINCTNQPLSPIISMKVDHFFQLYQIFQQNFQLITNMVVKGTQNSIKISIFELLQLNQILMSQAQVRKRQNYEWCLNKSKQLITHMICSKINITHPFFIDWLTISFSDSGLIQWQTQLILTSKILQQMIRMMLQNRNNNIVVCKIYKLLKIIFHNIAEIYIISSIEKHKNTNLNLINFDLLHHYLLNLKPIQSAVKQFKTINDPLFATCFNLYKIIYQYCQSIDTIFNLYIHIDICKITKPVLAEVIYFQRNQPCFNVYEKEIIKDLGSFYTDDMFLDQKPQQFSVKQLKQPHQINVPSINTQPIIQILPISSQPAQTMPLISQTNQPLIQKDNSLQQIKIDLSSNLQQADSKSIITYNKLTNTQNQEEACDKFTAFMRNQMKQSNVSLQSRRSKSKTPTKIKNELKKSKNKWMNSQESHSEIKRPFSSQVKERTKPNLSKTVNLMKIGLMRITKNRYPLIEKERQISQTRDSRLIGWLTALRA